MNVRKRFAITLTLCLALFTGCQSAAPSSPTESGFGEPTADSSFSVSSSAPESSASQKPEASSEPPKAPEASASSRETASDSSAPAEITPSPSASQTPSNSSAPSENPPAARPPSEPETVSSTPEDVPSTPAPEPETPVSSEPASSPEDKLEKDRLYYRPEDDPYGVVEIIREYAEEKGFVLDESLTMENSGWNGRPNVADWTLEGVINTLKFHVDKQLEIGGPAYYNVVFRIFQNKLEYIFLIR